MSFKRKIVHHVNVCSKIKTHVHHYTYKDPNTGQTKILKKVHEELTIVGC